MKRVLKFIGAKMAAILVMLFGLEALLFFIAPTPWFVWIPAFIVAVVTVSIPLIDYWTSVFENILSEDDQSESR
jgi:hypothetical protein